MRNSNTGFILKRRIPTAKQLDARELRMSSFGDIKITEQDLRDRPILQRGNSKIGFSGTVYSSAFVWNIPPILSCPGASVQCRRYCYNGDARPDVYDTEQWRTNLAWYQYRRDDLSNYLCSTIAAGTDPSACRIHSAGDFFSPDYTQFWANIIEKCPQCSFWAYTRSWRVPGTRDSLERLRELPNVQLFASWDHSMPSPPKDWRMSIVVDGITERHVRSIVGRAQLFDCPEQDGSVGSCVSCGHCMRVDNRGVLFTLH